MRKYLSLFLFIPVLTLNPAASGADFVQTDLVSDISGMAPELDTNLKNPWGVSFSAATPFWVSNQGSNTSTLYNASKTPVTQALVVNIPTAGNPGPAGPTGQVFNSTTSDFMIPAPGKTSVKAAFLFDTLDGTIQGWNPGSNGGLGASEIVAKSAGSVFTGLALDNSGGSNYLYAADATGHILTFNSSFQNVTGSTFAGKFVDPNALAGFTPFNIQNLGGHLFVTYAAATATGAPLPGGYVDEFDSAGNFVARIATSGPVNAPWGLALAPAGFGSFGGDLLVGNLYDSKIDAFNLGDGDKLDGSIAVGTGFSSQVGLWALAFGNGVSGGTDTLYFTSGINDQKDGLFGEIVATPEPASLFLLALSLGALGAFRRNLRKA